MKGYPKKETPKSAPDLYILEVQGYFQKEGSWQIFDKLGKGTLMILMDKIIQYQ